MRNEPVWVEIRPVSGIFTRLSKKVMGLSWIESTQKAIIPYRDESEAIAVIGKWSLMNLGKRYQCTILTDAQVMSEIYFGAKNNKSLHKKRNKAFIIGENKNRVS